ncbi:hypothetical protein AQB9606_00870 [Aquabacterium sp. CECT 9606]|nr:hypothetical protein AQB9606_00870 [Aquabacterium sp. CECT 9606]
MDRLQSMQIFCRVIDLNGFAAAARDLNLSPSVVTRLINELEEHLGSRLINRTTRKLVLTEAGERYLEQVRRILADVAQVEAEVGSDTADPRGVLKVLAPPAFAAHQLAPILPRFRALHPRIAIDLSAPGMVETLDENFDVSIIAAQGKPLDGSFVARQLATSAAVLCATPAYLQRHGRPTHPQDLLRHDMLTPKRPCELTFYPELDDQAQGDRPQALTLAVPSPALSTGHLDTIRHATLGAWASGPFLLTSSRTRWHRAPWSGCCRDGVCSRWASTRPSLPEGICQPRPGRSLIFWSAHLKATRAWTPGCQAPHPRPSRCHRKRPELLKAHLP